MGTVETRGRASLALVGRRPELRFYAERCAGVEAVLVLGCADGRVAFELAAQGATVLGVDPSVELLAQLEARRSSESSEVSNRVRAKRSDLRTFRSDQRFARVLLPQNAVGLVSTLEDLHSLLVTAQLHLSAGGLVVLDLVNSPTLNLPGPSPEGTGGPSAGVEPARPIFAPHLRERRRGTERRASTEGIHRLRRRPFTSEELDEALAQAGLQPMERYSGFSGEPFSPEDPLQVVVACLPEGD